MSKYTFRTGALSASCGTLDAGRLSPAESGVDVADGWSQHGLFRPGGPDSAEALGCNHEGLFMPCGLGSAEALGCSHGGRSWWDCACPPGVVSASDVLPPPDERGSAEVLGRLPPAVALGCSQDGR